MKKIPMAMLAVALIAITAIERKKAKAVRRKLAVPCIRVIRKKWQRY